MRRPRTRFARGVAAFMAAIGALQLGSARGAPGDLFSLPAPVIGAQPPAPAELRDGDTSVASQTGALEYSYAIAVPPGRGGAAPKLALHYSSQAPIYGGLAAGWSLSIPAILEDTAQGRLRTHAPEVESQQGAAAPADDRFISTLAGGRPLVAVTEPNAGAYRTYRAQGDATFTRYERMVSAVGYRWRAYTTDGTTLYFGDVSLTTGCANVSDGHAPLTRAVDAFGNEVRYTYESQTAGECRIKLIEWGHNPGAGIAQPFAQVAFTWERPPPCGGVVPGSQTSYRTGAKIVTGASKLIAITATAFAPGVPSSPEHTRTLTLGYSAADESCTGQHAPVRLLTSIQESAWGTDAPRVDLPAVTFGYGDASPLIDLITPQLLHGTPWGGLEPRRDNLAWGYRRNDDRWPTVEAMLVDLDGDGLLDRLTNASTATAPGDGQCRARWQRNLGPPSGSTHPQFGPEQTIALPRLKWNGTTTAASPIAGAANADAAYPHFEGCALNGQVTAFQNSVQATLCHNNTSCQAGSSAPGPFCYPGGTECPPGDGGGPAPFRTYLAYRWMDMDGDGLVDLVAAVHGDIDVYDIALGNTIVNGAPRPAEPDLFGPWPACPAMDRCKAVDPTCIAAARTCPAGGACTTSWPALAACFAAGTSVGCNDLIHAPATIQGPGGQPMVLREPYARCEGLYPWFIYKNTGRGTFASAPVIKYQPVPLESDDGDSSIVGPGIAASDHGVLDFDGDGVLDAVARPRAAEVGGDVAYWWVWLGDGSGGFGPTRYTFPTRDAPGNPVNGIGTTASQWARSSAGLLDVNGDGLPEHWLTSDVTSLLNANLAFHDGTKFRLFGPAPARGEVDTPFLSGSYAVKPGDDAKTTVTWADGPVIREGTSTQTNRVTDVDRDGRADVVQYLDGAPAPTVFFNLGGQFQAPGVPYPGDRNGFLRKAQLFDNAGDPLWELRGDLVDLDGDGVLEAAYFGVNGFVRAAANLNAPPRLLVAVHNGRGAHTAVTYASMHDAATVEQHPELAWSDGRPKATPLAQWVVKSVTTTDDFAGTTTTTTQRYKNPRHGADDTGHVGFRGFEEVTTTTPSGARLVRRYGYTPDWSGRLVATLTVPAEAPAEVRVIDRTTWVARTLFGGAITTYHVAVTEHLTCANGQTEATCTAAAAPAYVRRTTTQTSLASTTQPGGPALLWQDTDTLEQRATAAADGDRLTTSTFALAADASTYRLRPLGTTRQHRVAGAMTTYARTATVWDASYRVATNDETWVDAVDANRIRTRTEYDLATGNVTARWRPRQHEAATTRTTFTYDARKLFVASEVNELGHQRDFTYEYGTGAPLITSGPNARTCTTTCPTGAIYPVLEQHKVRVDGLGRPIEIWDTTSYDGAVYTLYQRESYSYVDSAGANPTSVTHQTRLDATTPTWRQERTDLDGNGRRIKETVFVQGSAPADQITIYRYRNDGTLQAVEVPDPTANSAARVTYTYGFDSLGRPTSIRRPDAAAVANQSGADVVYDGVTATTTDVVGAAGGAVGATRLVSDALGRLVSVQERTQVSPATWATTSYSYGPDDNVASVIDPQGVTTTLVHDRAGRRIQIGRGGRLWKYTYDKNGNQIAAQVPGSAGPTTDAAYTTTTVYDDLDRPRSRVIGQRALSAADQAAFGAGSELFDWDYGAMMKGHLRYWRSYAPGATQPMVTIDLLVDGLGNSTYERSTLSIAGLPSMTRGFLQTFALFGGVRTARYYDAFTAGGAESSTQINYDARGLPSQVVLARTGLPAQVLANQTRNVAGLVTNRRTTTQGTTTFVEANYTYDALGRVAGQVVQRGPTLTQLARQDVTRLGNDDVATMTHALGTASKQFTYAYDLRHQLTGVTTATAGYFNATYAYGAAGRLTRATVAQTINPLPAGTEVKPRDVSYVYGGADPEQVTALTTVSNGQTYASYSYDAAGNQLTRTYPGTGESWDYVHDGRDTLRRATRKVGGVVQSSEEYWYDHGGDRIAIVKRNAAGARTELVWFTGDAEAHLDGAGVLQRVYSHVTLGTPVARVERTSAGTTLEYQFHGLADSTLAAVDASGAVNASFRYAPFGEVIEATSGGAAVGTAVHPRRLNDKFVDEGTGLAYYGARYYDKTLIGWTQADPLFQFVPEAAWMGPRNANRYAFTRQNPLRYIDRDGRCSWTAPWECPIDGAKAVGEGIGTVANAAAGVAVAAGRKAAPVVVSLVEIDLMIAAAGLVLIATTLSSDSPGRDSKVTLEDVLNEKAGEGTTTGTTTGTTVNGDPYREPGKPGDVSDDVETDPPPPRDPHTIPGERPRHVPPPGKWWVPPYKPAGVAPPDGGRSDKGKDTGSGPTQCGRRACSVGDFIGRDGPFPGTTTGTGPFIDRTVDPFGW